MLITKDYTFSTGATILASEHNTNFDTLFNAFNGNIDNANIKSGANISLAKLSLSDDITMTGDWNFTSAATTDDMLTLTGSSLTTGSALKVYSNSSSTSTRNLVEIINDHSDADDTVCLLIQQDGDDYAIDCGTTGKIRGVGTDISRSGQQVQVVNVQSGAVDSSTTVVPEDDTIPQNTEGEELYTLAITPKSATNKLLIQVKVNMVHSTGQSCILALFQDDTAGALCAGRNDGGAAYQVPEINFTYYMTAGTTSETTFKLRYGPSSSGTAYVNANSTGTRYLGGVLISSMTITEIEA